MTFTAGGTQTNATAINITGEASITDGVRFTISQSWSIGDVFTVTGTTIDIQGTWYIDPEIEEVIWDDIVVSNALQVKNDGVWLVGRKIVIPNYTRYSFCILGG